MLEREHGDPCPWFSCHDEHGFTGVMLLDLDDGEDEGEGIERMWFAADDALVRHESGDTCEGITVECTRLERSKPTCQEWGE
jgi:hypothetical protein